jgi:predicted HTH domain antitoxin
MFIGLSVRMYQLEERQMDVMQSGVVSFTGTSRYASMSIKAVRQELTPCTKTYVHLGPYF